MNAPRQRLDAALVTRGLVESRSRAREAISAGLVRVNGDVVHKPSATVADDALIEAQTLHPYVSRAALKLAHALEVFGVSVRGRRCLDVGSSTGGFSEVLLRGEASHVTAVDVGRDQLHASLRDHPRLTLREATDIREVTRNDLPAPVELITCDVSFISVTKALHGFSRFFDGSGELILLFKPQFEVGRAHIGKRGIVSDQQAVTRAQGEVADWLAREGATVMGWAESPITGGDGNREYLVYARWTRP